MIYEDKELYKELQKLLTECLTEIDEYCPYCGNSVLPQYDCKNCGNDHMGSQCWRDGEHNEDCLLLKHSALVDIDLDG